MARSDPQRPVETGATAPRIEDDRDLAARCVDGDAGAQRELFHRHRRDVHRILYRSIGGNVDIEALVQDAFLEIFRSLPSYRGDAQLGTWIARITVRVAYAEMGRRKRRPLVLESVPAMESREPSAQRQVLAREAAKRLYDVLDKVKPLHRLAFILHAVDGRPLREVADMMETTVVATKARVWRARREVMRRADKDPVLRDYLSEAVDG